LSRRLCAPLRVPRPRPIEFRRSLRHRPPRPGRRVRHLLPRTLRTSAPPPAPDRQCRRPSRRLRRQFARDRLVAAVFRPRPRTLPAQPRALHDQAATPDRPRSQDNPDVDRANHLAPISARRRRPTVGSQAAERLNPLNDAPAGRPGRPTDARRMPLRGRSPLRRASRIDLNALLTSLDPPGKPEARSPPNGAPVEFERFRRFRVRVARDTRREFRGRGSS
jgi:hypothetical protein